MVASELSTAISKIEQAEEIVEAKLINTVLTFHLSVVTGRSNADTLEQDVHVSQYLLKEWLVLGPSNQQYIGEFGTVICLDQPDRV